MGQRFKLIKDLNMSMGVTRSLICEQPASLTITYRVKCSFRCSEITIALQCTTYRRWVIRWFCPRWWFCWRVLPGFSPDPTTVHIEYVLSLRILRASLYSRQQLIEGGVGSRPTCSTGQNAMTIIRCTFILQSRDSIWFTIWSLHYVIRNKMHPKYFT